MAGLVPSIIQELRLTSFKSFSGAALPFSDLTLLIGRNGSGKSNAMDGLEVLSKLADGDDIREAIDGHRGEGPVVRGGVEGCAPSRQSAFSLGCSVRTGSEVVNLDVTVQVEPDVQIISERLWKPIGARERTLLCTDDPQEGLGDIVARHYNAKQGLNPPLLFRSSRLLTTQVATRVPLTTKASREVHEAAESVLTALGSVFVLDPVPALMRQYVSARDWQLRRRAENLSAAVDHLRSDKEAWERLLELVRALPEQRVEDITIERSKLGDVMLVLRERMGTRRRRHRFPARLMSDGMLRFLACAAALLETPTLDSPADVEAGESVAQTTLVIEEIENGLHPSQAAHIVRLIKAESQRRRIRTLASTHSPAILSVLEAEDHAGVIVCDRDPDTGESRLRRLVDLPGYPRAMASGTLGDAVIQQKLTQRPDGEQAVTALDRLLEQI